MTVHPNSALALFTSYQITPPWISENETEHRKEMENSIAQCQDNNFFLNVSKTKELVMDFRSQDGVHVPVRNFG